MIDSFAAKTERTLEIMDLVEARLLQQQIKEYENAISVDERYRNIIRWADRDFSSICWTNPLKAQKLVMKAMEILRKNPYALLSETKEITEKFYALIKRQTFEDPVNTEGRNMVMDILST